MSLEPVEPEVNEDPTTDPRFLAAEALTRALPVGTLFLVSFVLPGTNRVKTVTNCDDDESRQLGQAAAKVTDNGPNMTVFGDRY